MLGMTQFRRGNKYQQDLLGKVKAVRIGGTRSKKQTKVNAKANTKGEVAINGRGVKIARRSAAVLA